MSLASYPIRAFSLFFFFLSAKYENVLERGYQKYLKNITTETKSFTVGIQFVVRCPLQIVVSILDRCGHYREPLWLKILDSSDDWLILLKPCYITLIKKSLHALYNNKAKKKK